MSGLSEPSVQTANHPFPIVVLISGSGSNLQAIIDSTTKLEPAIDIRAVISNNPQAYGLQRATRNNIPCKVVDHRHYPDRNAYDAALQAVIDSYQPRLVVLAGFMRILTTDFVNQYAGRLMNIHPSLLPLYPGLNTHQRAIDNGDKEAGATVHFVTPEVDGGPVIIQAHVPVLDTDSCEDLSSRVLEQEHQIYPRAIQWFSQGRLTIDNGKVLLDGKSSPQQQVFIDEN